MLKLRFLCGEAVESTNDGGSICGERAGSNEAVLALTVPVRIVVGEGGDIRVCLERGVSLSGWMMLRL